HARELRAALPPPQTLHGCSAHNAWQIETIELPDKNTECRVANKPRSKVRAVLLSHFPPNLFAV
ncbi:MAG TPA: hypothetical protein VM715_09180, partial [Candidatus Acidoferrum sp.]|nr:hypothetical protein [Candidatus Acidoferrum sp.]